MTIPRRRKRKTAEKTVEKQGEETGTVAKKTTGKKSRRKYKVKRLDTHKLASQVYDDVKTFLGLDMLGLPDDISREIVYEVIDTLYGEASSKPKIDAILKKIKRFREHVDYIIASKILERIKEPNDVQLEFLVQSGGRAIIPEISRIYKLIIKRGRRDLLPYLEAIWEKHGFPSPVKCPKCGFRAIMPDFSCYICGYVVTEEYIRKELNFEEKLKTYVESASVAELRDVLELGYVLLSEDGIYSPRYRHKLSFEKKIFYPVSLKSRDRLIISEAMSNRKIEI
ncbi:MAG: hypothetical protein ABWW65_06720 [Thermoprotei archaeon]